MEPHSRNRLSNNTDECESRLYEKQAQFSFLDLSTNLEELDELDDDLDDLDDDDDDDDKKSDLLRKMVLSYRMTVPVMLCSE